MLTACWSVKGGSGTTVVAATLAITAARHQGRVVLADMAGDLPAALGVADPTGPGLGDWLAAGAGVPADALERLSSTIGDDIAFVGRGADVGDDRSGGARLADALRAFAGDHDAVADCGRADTAAAAAVVAHSDRSLLVLRPCYLALRRAVGAPRPDGVVLVREPDRSLGPADVEDVLGVAVVAELAWDPAIARAVDAGLLSSRLPRRLANALRAVPA